MRQLPQSNHLVVKSNAAITPYDPMWLGSNLKAMSYEATAELKSTPNQSIEAVVKIRVVGGS